MEVKERNDFQNMLVHDFVEDLASKAPVPGGGGASALAGALGTALGNMVGSLTVGKRKYAAVEAQFYDMMARCDSLQRELLALIEMDAEAFAPLAKAYSLPKDTPEEKAARAEIMEEALLGACVVPLRIMHKCCEALDLIKEFADKGSRLAVSDAGAGAVLCEAALRSASLNVFINTRSMEDRAKAQELDAKADAMLEQYVPLAEEIYRNVQDQLR